MEKQSHAGPYYKRTQTPLQTFDHYDSSLLSFHVKVNAMKKEAAINKRNNIANNQTKNDPIQTNSAAEKQVLV